MFPVSRCPYGSLFFLQDVETMELILVQVQDKLMKELTQANWYRAVLEKGFASAAPRKCPIYYTLSQPL